MALFFRFYQPTIPIGGDNFQYIQFLCENQLKIYINLTPKNCRLLPLES